MPDFRPYWTRKSEIHAGFEDYGLLIASRPVIIWNVIAVFINFLTVGAYTYFLRKERQKSLTAATG